MRVLVTIDPLHALLGACGSVAASALAVATDVAMVLMGVPVAVVVLSFGGTFYGIGYREPMTWYWLWFNILGGTFFASAIAPLAAYPFGLPVALTAPIGGLLGFFLQYAHPWLKARRERILDKTADKVLGDFSDKGETQ